MVTDTGVLLLPARSVTLVREMVYSAPSTRGRPVLTLWVPLRRWSPARSYRWGELLSLAPPLRVKRMAALPSCSLAL